MLFFCYLEKRTKLHNDYYYLNFLSTPVQSSRPRIGLKRTIVSLHKMLLSLVVLNLKVLENTCENIVSVQI